MQSQPMVYLVTYGCKVNYHESETVASILGAAGIENEMVSDGSIARLPAGAVFVVNSCAVTSMAEKKTRYGLAKIRKYHPNAQIVTMGCALGRKTPLAVAREVAQIVGGAVHETITQHRREKAFVKVQDGCQNFCAYCIIPHKRTEISCRPISDVCAEINAQGPHVQHVVICGINLCYYPDFAALCRAVDSCGRAWSISSLEPPIFTPALIETLALCRHFVPNFHICLQSGCDSVLAAMNRHYSAADFARIIAALREKFPRAHFSSDIIVGYPTETESDFWETYHFLQKLNLDHLHLFPFSPRPETPAAQLKPITNAVVSARLEKLAELNH